MPEMSDLLLRLRTFSGWTTRDVPGVFLNDTAIMCWDAIDEIERLRDALQCMIDFVGDGCPDGSYGYCMTEAKAALNGIRAIPSAALDKDKRAPPDAAGEDK
jgi:hypothetical protein